MSDENLRLRLLRGESIEADDPLSPEVLVVKARRTLDSVMDDHDAKPSERAAAADSILDRYGEPRKKFELGGSRTVNLSLSPEAMASALGSLSKLFTGSLPKEVIDVPSSPPAGSLPAPDDHPGTPPS